MTIALGRSTHRARACAVAIAAIAAGLQAFTPSASAADMPVRPQPQVVERPLWTGFYIGAHGGGGWGSTHIQDPTFSVTYDTITVKSSGALAGAQIGANWQFGSFVIGAELDASWSSIRGHYAPTDQFRFGGFDVKYRALATGTARVGYAAGPWLLYAKGGFAWADIALTGFVDTVAPRTINHHRTGATGGAGLEVAFWQNLSAKVEYNVVYFGEQSMVGGRDGAINVDHLVHLVKGGINLRFGGDTLAARY